jgi:membrane protein DedA with SNARE-associated domain
MAFGLLALLFAGMFLHEHGVPVWVLIIAGLAGAIILNFLQRRAFRAFAWRNPRRR